MRSFVVLSKINLTLALKYYYVCYSYYSVLYVLWGWHVCHMLTYEVADFTVTACLLVSDAAATN